MSSLHSDDLQSLHGIASDSGYTSAASTASKSRKRAPSLTSLRSSRSRSTSSNRRASSLNAKFDRLNSSMNDVAAASATSAGADPSLGVKRKTIAQSAEGTRGSVQGSAPVRRNDLGEEEVEEGSWREDEAGERERRKKRRMNEAISGPGSSLGAVGEAFRLLSWEGRRGSREAAGEGEARSTRGYDQHDHVQLDRVPSPSGSGRVRTLARDAGWGPSQRDRSPPPMALPPWMVNEKPTTPPRTYSPPPEWLARIMASSAPRRSPPSPYLPPRANYGPSQPNYLPSNYGPHPFPSAPPLDWHIAHAQPSPYSQQTAFPPTPFSTSGRMDFTSSRAGSSYGPPSQQPLYEAQLARESSATNVWREEGAPVAEIGWSGVSDGMSFASGGLGSGGRFGPPTGQQHLARHPSPPTPPSRSPPLYASQIKEQSARSFADASYHPHRPSPASHSFDYPSTTALLRANGWQSPSQPFEYSLVDNARGLEPHATSSDPHEEPTHAIGNFWKRAPRPARMDDVQALHRPPTRDRYAESLLQRATAPEMLAPHFPSPPQCLSPSLNELPRSSVNHAFPSHLFDQPSSTPRKQQPIADHPPPLSRKSSSSAARAPLLLVSQLRPQKQAPTPLCTIAKPTLSFPAPIIPPPTRQRSFPLLDPVFRPSTAPNPPTSPLLHEETEEHLEHEDKQQLAGTTSNLRAADADANASHPHLLPLAPDASPLRAPSTVASGDATQEATPGQLDGEEGEGEEEDDFESRSTDGDSIFHPSLGETTMTTRLGKERELSPLEEDAEEEEQLGEEGEGAEEGLLAGANFSIFEDPEDPIHRFTQD